MQLLNTKNTVSLGSENHNQVLEMHLRYDIQEYNLPCIISHTAPLHFPGIFKIPSHDNSTCSISLQMSGCHKCSSGKGQGQGQGVQGKAPNAPSHSSSSQARGLLWWHRRWNPSRSLAWAPGEQQLLTHGSKTPPEHRGSLHLLVQLPAAAGNVSPQPSQAFLNALPPSAQLGSLLFTWAFQAALKTKILFLQKRWALTTQLLLQQANVLLPSAKIAARCAKWHKNSFSFGSWNIHVTGHSGCVKAQLPSFGFFASHRKQKDKQRKKG